MSTDNDMQAIRAKRIARIIAAYKRANQCVGSDWPVEIKDCDRTKARETKCPLCRWPVATHQVFIGKRRLGGRWTDRHPWPAALGPR